jgi:hypothetical protein
MFLAVQNEFDLRSQIARVLYILSEKSQHFLERMSVFCQTYFTTHDTGGIFIGSVPDAFGVDAGSRHSTGIQIDRMLR